MTQGEMQKNAKIFAENWAGKGDEKQETSRFWIGILGEVLGVLNPQNYIEFEKRVKLSHTSFIDAYIPETKVLIEQKGIKIDLNKAYEQSDGTVLTPYQQAKRYADEMPYDLRPRWIVVSNFAEIHVHDMNKPDEPPQVIFLKDLERDCYRLEFLVDRKNENIRREVDISIAAGALVGKMYDALVKEYINPTAESYRSLNILCVRLVFCFYAEDAGLFETRTSFEDYIKSFAIENLRAGLIALFKALDTKLDSRDKYDTKLKPFPYVNGGLFHDENIEIPNFTQKIVDVLVNDCAPFNWAEISPTIFGAVFESTLNPETRRKGGMHYTSIENIHKVIDPLFLDGLENEFNVIASEAKQSQKQYQSSLLSFQNKLGSLTFLDPACGSGNFLTETYLSLRRLENKVISALNKGEKVLGFDEFIKVKISQFYGIEINDFAVTVAKTALWIAESQMINETEKIISQQIDFLPLKTQANIVEGNALRMDWETLTNIDGTKTEQPMLFEFSDDRQETLDNSKTLDDRHQTLETNGKKTNVYGLKSNVYDYIMGNPPFVGYAYQSKTQKEDLHSVSKEIANNIDYVAGWYFKAASLIQNSETKCAFVSTNSITQGEQVALLCKPLFEKYHIKIDFAWRTFRWDSESTEKAHVHCVIIGFSGQWSVDSGQKFIIDEKGERHIAKNINGYLLDAPTIFIEKNAKPICDVPPMIRGSSPIDDGNLLLTEEEKSEYEKAEPQGKKFLRPFMMGKDFIERKPRWCFWLVDASPFEIRKCPKLMKRLENIRSFRLKSPKAATKELAETPTLFGEMRECKSEYIAIPKVSSENRKYIPIDYLQPEILAGDKLFQMPNATLFHFGVLTSSVHMAWMRAVCGRLEMRYSYSNTIVYNNFVFPSVEKRSSEFSTSENSHVALASNMTAHPCASVLNPRGNFLQCTIEQAKKIEQTAQAILDARTKYPESSFADLYDNLAMPLDLRKAHEANDHAVMQAYGFDTKMTEAEIVAELFKMYERLAKNQ